ncbi:MAG: response regulator [Spirochaetaceae bacterium]|jgi:two-component system response regulator YesN|nr:response regulator [Spirochaetaceae bacterium]
MLGILIVDDDALVRMNLKSIIEWEKEGFVITGEAENGKKGLELIRRDKPDIVITDVKMPVMDGLEMIRNARAEHEGVRFIVLSSYEEFGLLKTAVNNGVTDYLLKLELTPEVLLCTLEGIKKSILYEDNTTRNVEISPYSRLAKMLRMVLIGYYTEEELEHTLKMVNQDIKTERLSCIAVRFSLSGKGASFGAEDWRTLEIAVHSVIHNITKQFYPGISFLEDTGVCLFVYSPDGGCGRVREMGNIIITTLKQYFNLESSVGVASLTGSINDIHRIMIDAIQATEEVFFKGFGTVIFSSGVSGGAASAGTGVYNWTETFRQALELHRKEDLKGIFKTLNGILASQRRPLVSKNSESGDSPLPASGISRSEAFNLCFSLVNTTLSVLRDNKAVPGFFNENLYEAIGRIETLRGLWEWVKSFEAAVMGWLDSIYAKSHDDFLIDSVKRYVTENFHRPVSLNKAAEHLAISSGYLSSLFKRCTGLCFVDYVTRVKISEAEKLLLSGRYRVGEIAEMVGYEDAGYFSKIFRKITGFSPKEYMIRHI